LAHFPDMSTAKQETRANAHKTHDSIGTTTSQISNIMLAGFEKYPNCKKIIRSSYFWGSRSLMLVHLESSSEVLVMITSKSRSICSCSHVNNGKITISQMCTPLSHFHLKGISSCRDTKFCYKKSQRLSDIIW